MAPSPRSGNSRAGANAEGGTIGYRGASAPRPAIYVPETPGNYPFSSRSAEDSSCSSVGSKDAAAEGSATQTPAGWGACDAGGGGGRGGGDCGDGQGREACCSACDVHRCSAGTYPGDRCVGGGSGGSNASVGSDASGCSGGVVRSGGSYGSGDSGDSGDSGSGAVCAPETLVPPTPIGRAACNVACDGVHQLVPESEYGSEPWSGAASTDRSVRLSVRGIASAGRRRGLREGERAEGGGGKVEGESGDARLDWVGLDAGEGEHRGGGQGGNRGGFRVGCYGEVEGDASERMQRVPASPRPAEHRASAAVFVPETQPR
eukprot:3162224-Pleurochrysis_carterae.AAC.2